MKAKEVQNVLKETPNRKLTELNEEALMQVTGGAALDSNESSDRTITLPALQRCLDQQATIG